MLLYIGITVSILVVILAIFSIIFFIKGSPYVGVMMLIVSLVGLIGSLACYGII